MQRSGPEWRFGRGWTRQEIEGRLASLRSRPLDTTAESRMDPVHGYGPHSSEALIALEPHGLPASRGPFERARSAVESYVFSDPRIVTGHFDPRDPLIGRPMLLEFHVWGLRYLCGVRVSALREERDPEESVFGFRYHTVPPHIESGFEWFLLTKRHDTGEVRFRIEAMWRPGQFPNWWSRVGFALLARHRQRAWQRLAHLRLRSLVAVAPKNLLRDGGGGEMHRTNGLAPWMKAAAVGAVVGSRSLLMPALVTRAARLRRGARVWSVLAALEMAADKTPWIPSRTSPLSLAGRMVIGAGVAFAMASSPRTGWPRRPTSRLPVVAALIGASSAAASAFVLRAVRLRLVGTKRGAGIVGAVCEDLLALGAGCALSRTLQS